MMMRRAQLAGRTEAPPPPAHDAALATIIRRAELLAHLAAGPS
jgi:hypothetical protein